MAKNITKKKIFPVVSRPIQAGQLADYAPVRGCMIIRPKAIWEKMQAILDKF